MTRSLTTDVEGGIYESTRHQGTVGEASVCHRMILVVAERRESPCNDHGTRTLLSTGPAFFGTDKG